MNEPELFRSYYGKTLLNEANVREHYGSLLATDETRTNGSSIGRHASALKL
ncbi:MAG: hypothetical protein IIB82_04025 [Bacteroidetes bacterium]|nr:hypothetical protein [Bacteroidota bacterium]